MVEALPDVATVRLNIQVTRPTASQAKADAADATAAVLAAVRAVPDFNDSQVSTANLAVFPQYIYNDRTQTQKINGYTFRWVRCRAVAALRRPGLPTAPPLRCAAADEPSAACAAKFCPSKSAT